MAYLDKRWVGVFNYRWRRRFQHDLRRLSLAVAYILDTRPDLAICTGDLTSTGQPGEFEKVRPILAPLRDSGIPVIYLPGNHDCYVKRPQCVRAVREMTAWLTHGDYEFTDLPLERRYGECDFYSVNCSRPSNLLCSWGFLSRRDRDWLLERLARPKERPRILINHYPLHEGHPLLRVRHRLFGQSRIREALRAGTLDLSLCGHVHKPFAHLDASGRGESCAGSVTRNGTISTIEYQPAGDRFVFETVRLD